MSAADVPAGTGIVVAKGAALESHGGSVVPAVAGPGWPAVVVADDGDTLRVRLAADGCVAPLRAAAALSVVFTVREADLLPALPCAERVTPLPAEEATSAAPLGAGTTLWWPDGVDAGWLRAPAVLPEPWESGGDRVCGHFTLTDAQTASGPALLLCADVAEAARARGGCAGPGCMGVGAPLDSGPMQIVVRSASSWGGDAPEAAIGAEATVIGALDRTAVDAVLARNRAGIRSCYTRTLADAPGLSGAMEVAFLVSRDGSVASASVRSSTLGDPTMEACVVSHVRTFEFPEPRGGGIAVVTYPLRFTSAK